MPTELVSRVDRNPFPFQPCFLYKNILYLLVCKVGFVFYKYGHIQSLLPNICNFPNLAKDPILIHRNLHIQFANVFHGL